MKTVNEIENILPQPIVIEITNTSATTRNNIVLYGGMSFTPALINPYLGVTIKSGVSGTTYASNVVDSQAHPVKIGMIGFASLSMSTPLIKSFEVDSQDLLIKSFEVDSQDPPVKREMIGFASFTPTLVNQLKFYKRSITASGAYSNITLKNDPNGFKAIVNVPVDFTIDEESAILLGTIHPNEKVILYLYPAIPEMKQVSFPDVDAGIIKVSKSLFVSGATEKVILGSPNYKTYRLVGGAVICAAIAGLLYWIGTELKE